MANFKNYGKHTIPATVLDSSSCRVVVFETLRLLSHGEIWSFGGADYGTGNKDWSKMKSKLITNQFHDQK